MDNKNKICKHYVMGNCKNGGNCTYKHQDNICRDFFYIFNIPERIIYQPREKREIENSKYNRLV